MMRDGKLLNPPDFYSQTITRANQSINLYNNEAQESSQIYQKNNKLFIMKKKEEMNEEVECSSHRNDKQLNEMNKIREWLDSLNRDEQFFQKINDETNFPTDSSYSVIERLISEERKKRSGQGNFTLKNKILFEKEIEEEKENLRMASYTRSIITFSKDLIILQKEIHEAMKPENILNKESSTALRFENLRKKLEIELENRKETEKRLKKELKGATKLFNSHVEYHKKLEEELAKLQGYLTTYQSKSAIEIIEKAKKNNFITSQWNLNQKDLNSRIKEIDIEINKYKNTEQTTLELKNMIYGNNLEIEKTKKNYEETIASIQQEIKMSSFVQNNALQILEKEMMNSLNFHRGTESKNTQTAKKMATTSFSRTFMKYSKDKQTCLNKFEKTLRRNNISFEGGIEGLNIYNEENRKAFTDAVDQMINEMKKVMEDYNKVFVEKHEYEDHKIKFQWKNEYDILIGRKQRLSSQIMYRETDILINQSTYNVIEGVYLDILQAFSESQEEKYEEIKSEIQNINNFIQKASRILVEYTQKLQIFMKNAKNKKKRASSMIVQIRKPIFKNESKTKDDEFQLIEETKNEEQLKIEIPKQVDSDLHKNEPSPPKSGEHSPRFSSKNKEKEKKMNSTEKLPFSTHQQSDSKLHYSVPSVAPDFFLMRKKKRSKDEPLRNKIKDNSPHFSERKPRKPRREKSRMEIEEARRATIQSRTQTQRTIQDIPKIPFIKNVDPKIINEIDSTYSFSGDFSKNKIKTKKISKNKETPKEDNHINIVRNSNSEFHCIIDNINVTKENIFDLPFAKRSMQTKEVSSVSKSPIKNEQIEKVNVSTKVFNFSEMTLNNYAFQPQIKIDQKLNRSEILKMAEKIINQDQSTPDQCYRYKSGKLISTSASTPSASFKNINFKSSLEINNKKNEPRRRKHHRIHHFRQMYDN